jgi:hypothetical protein
MIRQSNFSRFIQRRNLLQRRSISFFEKAFGMFSGTSSSEPGRSIDRLGSALAVFNVDASSDEIDSATPDFNKFLRSIDTANSPGA